MALDIVSAQRPVGPSIFNQAMQGFQLGQENKLAAQQAQEAQAATEAKQLRQQEIQQALTGLASNPRATGRDFANVMIQFPEIGDQLKQPFDILSTEQQEISRKDALNVFAALEAGQPEIAIGLVERQIEAARNSGDEEGAASNEALLKIMEADPDAAKSAAGLFLSNAMGADEFDSVLGQLRERAEQADLGPIQKRKLIADSELTEAQAVKVLSDIGALGIDTQKAVLELEALRQGGQALPPEKIFDMELKLKNDFNTRSADLEKSRVTFDRLESSANESLNASAEEIKGPADVALVTSFMKMLDPGSVVRESEFALARDTAGLITKLKNILLQKPISGGFLSDEQRQSFTNLSRKYLEATEKQADRIKKSLGPIIKNYGLNSENIFGPSELINIEDEDLDAEIARLQEELAK